MSAGEIRRRKVTGLRELKKRRTRTDIQRHALELFRAQGFHATTVEQVAEAAEVAASTVFRYFPRKDDLARIDQFHPLRDALVDAFREQPADLTALTALRRALHAAFASLDLVEQQERQERDVGLLDVPEMWSANIPTVVEGVEVIGELVAERTGRPADDAAVRSLTGAVLGVALDVLLRGSRQGDLDVPEELDRALDSLEDAVSI